MDLSALAPQLNTTDVSSLQKTIEQHEMQAGMRNYSQMVGTCFGSCIGDFTSAKMAEKEVECTNLCMARYLKISQRIVLRFTEKNAEINQEQAKQ